MPPTYRVISIGTLAAHPLWNERVEVRTGHATTTLITTGDANVLVDPSLPAQALMARLAERSPVRAHEITHVFMTSADPLHRRALGVLPDARWLAHETELAAAMGSLEASIRAARNGNDEELLDAFESDLATLRRIEPAPDRITPGVDIFPLPGATPGSCGILLPLPRATVLICGDAIATEEHLHQGKVLPGCHDVERAQESFREAVEIADILVLGRDNAAHNPLRGM